MRRLRIDNEYGHRPYETSHPVISAGVTAAGETGLERLRKSSAEANRGSANEPKRAGVPDGIDKCSWLATN